MKSNLSVITFFLLLPLFVSSQTGAGGTLVVKVDKISSSEGKLLIALCSSESEFKEDKETFRYAKMVIRGGEEEYKFEDIPFGSYAIKIFHDENNNGELDKSFIGLPKEDYGFSNNPVIRFGPPSFEETAFKFSRSNQAVTINLH